MTLELNNALLSDAAHAVTMLAQHGQLTCLTGGTAAQRTRWIEALMGFEPLTDGFVCLDGEPLQPRSADAFRRLMAYAPKALADVGQLTRYEAPTPQQVFHLRRNRQQPISNAILAEEQRRTGAPADDPRTPLLAVAALLHTPILLVDDPPPAAADYLWRLATDGDRRLLVVASSAAPILQAAHQTVLIG